MSTDEQIQEIIRRRQAALGSWEKLLSALSGSKREARVSRFTLTSASAEAE